MKEIVKTPSGNVKVKETSENNKTYFHEEIGLDKASTKVSAWVFVILTYVIGDVVTTYYATQHYGLMESNPIVLLTGLHAEPIAFTKAKLVIVGIALLVNILMVYFLDMARLERSKVYGFYLSPLILSIIGLGITILNTNAILSV